MEARHIPLPLESEELHRSLSEEEIAKYDGRSANDNMAQIEAEAQTRQITSIENARKVAEGEGDVLMSRAIIIPTREQVKAGIAKKPVAVDEFSLEYITSRFPIGSEVNLDLGHKTVRAAVLRVDKEGMRTNLLTFFVDDFGGLKWKKVFSSDLLQSNKGTKDVALNIMKADQVQNLLSRIQSGEIKSAD